MANASCPPRRPPPPRTVSAPAQIGQNVMFKVDIDKLQPAQIRWFYMESGKTWTPFSGSDSLLLEEKRTHVLNSDEEDAFQEVEVLGNMYIVEVFKTCANLKPIYWSACKSCAVTRGTWFEVVGGQWLPLPEDEASIIEEGHTRKDWRERARSDAELSAWAKANSDNSAVGRKGSLPQTTVVLYQLIVKGYEVVWIGDDEVIKVKKDLSTRVWSKVRGNLYGSIKLMRGYREPSLLNDCLPPIGHLVFAIHGIGQNMESADVVKSTADLRDTCIQVAKKHFPEKWNDRRVEFIPIEWRTWLTLDKGTLKSITPHNVKYLRSMINDSVLDVMYYMSPKYGQEILDGFGLQLNKKYSEFIRRHPNFVSNGGTVSLFGHSLGSVMCFDLLYETGLARGLIDKGQPQLLNRGRTSIEEQEDDMQVDGPDEDYIEEQFTELQKARQRVAELEEKILKKTTLKFSVNHLFAVGSPLGIFIMLKEHESFVKRDFKGADSLLPTALCCRIHNLHHPSDPVAYRIEPLINPIYSQIKPVKIDSASSKPTQKSKVLAEGPKQPEASSQASSKSSFWDTITSGVMKTIGSSQIDGSKIPEEKVLDDDSKINPENRLKERLDFMLRESFTENSYLNSLTAHMCYWTNTDTAMYILLQIYTHKNT